jgi:hypothetical protein
MASTLLHTEWYAVLAAFVALNTIMYCALAVSKVLPKLYISDWISSPNRRTQTRSIYPDGYSLEDEQLLAERPDDRVVGV